MAVGFTKQKAPTRRYALISALLCVLTLLALCLPCAAWAAAGDTGTQGDYAYTVNDDEESVTITKCSSSDEELTIPEELDGYKVTALGSYSMQYCSKLKSVTVPGSVKTIRESAFRYCNALESVTICDGVETIDSYAFNECKALKSVSIAGSVKTIGSFAFIYCRSLESVTLGEGIESIGQSAFFDCTKLSSVVIPDSMVSIGDRAFMEDSGITTLTLGKGLTDVGQLAFYECTSLTTLEIPGNLKTLGYGVFSYCTGLESVTIDDGVEVIGDSAFRSCPLTEPLIIPDSVKSIDQLAFSGCDGMQSIVIPEGVESIGYCAFAYCAKLQSVRVPTTLTSMDSAVFSHSPSVEMHGTGDCYAKTWADEDGTTYVVDAVQVSFETNGAGEVGSQIVMYGDLVTDPQLAKDDYILAGWYTDSAFQKKFDIAATAMSDDYCGLTLYAKWEPAYPTVTFVTNGGTYVESLTVAHGTVIDQPECTRGGYNLLGWYSDEALTNPFDFSTEINDDMTLYASWAEKAAPTSFTDVSYCEWYYGWVEQAANRELMNGYKDSAGDYTGLFGPEDSLTRAQVATVIWRMAGSPEAAWTGRFPDVAEGAWYATAVEWCAAQGIVTGYIAGDYEGTFRPEGLVTREELAVMVYRYAKYAGAVSEDVPTANFDRCRDTTSVSDWSREAMVWCAAAGVLTGEQLPEGYFLNPQAGATRAQAAKVLVQADRLAEGEVDPYSLDELIEEGAEAQTLTEEAATDEQDGATAEANDSEEATFDEVTPQTADGGGEVADVEAVDNVESTAAEENAAANDDAPQASSEPLPSPEYREPLAA